MSRMSLKEAVEILTDREYEFGELRHPGKKYYCKRDGVQLDFVNGYEVVKFAKTVSNFTELDDRGMRLCDQYNMEKDWDKKGDLFFQCDDFLNQYRGQLSITVRERLQFIIFMG